MSLPDRGELEKRVRHFRIEGYELDDLVQEAYLCLLHPESDGNIERHLNRLKMRHYRRIVKVERRARRDYELYLDDAKARASGDIDALALMIACESECDNNAERWLLNELATGSGYEDFCRAWNCRKAAAWKRISRFRAKLRERIPVETFGDFGDGDGGGTYHELPAPRDLCGYDLPGVAVE